MVPAADFLLRAVRARQRSADRRGAFGPRLGSRAQQRRDDRTLAVFAVAFGVAPAHDDPATWDTARIALLAGGATLGVALQAVVLLAFWRRTGLRFRPSFAWRGAGLGAPARAAAGSSAWFSSCKRRTSCRTRREHRRPERPLRRRAPHDMVIFMLSHSIIAISIATPYFTRMSIAARDADLASLRSDLSAALRSTALLVTGARNRVRRRRRALRAVLHRRRRPVAILRTRCSSRSLPDSFRSVRSLPRATRVLRARRHPHAVPAASASGSAVHRGSARPLAAPSAWVAMDSRA